MASRNKILNSFKETPLKEEPSETLFHLQLGWTFCFFLEGIFFSPCGIILTPNNLAFLNLHFKEELSIKGKNSESSNLPTCVNLALCGKTNYCLQSEVLQAIVWKAVWWCSVLGPWTWSMEIVEAEDSPRRLGIPCNTIITWSQQ
jgi:hypothetical protein